MGKIPASRWLPRGRSLSRRRSLPPTTRPPSKAPSARSSRITKLDKKSSSSSIRRRPSMDIVEGISRWLPYTAIGRRIAGTRLIAFKVPLKMSYVRRLDDREQFTVEKLLDSVPELGLVIDLTQTDRYYDKQEFLMRGVHYAKIPSPGQKIPPEDVVLRFFSAVDYYLDHHAQDNTVVGVHCTHGVNRTGYMLVRYLVQRLGIPFREALMSITSARNHEIERKPLLRELETHTNLLVKESSSKDIQFSRMRGDRVSDIRVSVERQIPTDKTRTSSSRNINWREEKMKLSRGILMRENDSPGKFSEQICDGRNKAQQRGGMVAGKYYPAPPAGYQEAIDKRIETYGDEFWDKDTAHTRKRSRSRDSDRDMRAGVCSRSEGRTRANDGRHHNAPPITAIHRHRSLPKSPPRQPGQPGGVAPPLQEPTYMREPGGIYDERYRERLRTSSPNDFDGRPIVEEGRRNYRENKAHIPIEEEQPRGFPDNYIKSSISGRERPPIMDNVPPYEHHQARMEQHYNDGNRFRDYEQRLRLDIRPSSPHFRGRYGNVPQYARGEIGSIEMPYMPEMCMDKPNSRDMDVSVQITDVHLVESNMPVGVRRVNECMPENTSQRVHVEHLHMIGGRADDVHFPRGHRNEDMRIIHDGPLNRPMSSRELVEFRDRERRELRRSPSRGRPGYNEQYGPRGVDMRPPPYEVGGTSGRYDSSPIRTADREPTRRRTSSPRQAWPGAQRNPPVDYARMNRPDISPHYRDYPPFRGNNDPPLPPRQLSSPSPPPLASLSQSQQQQAMLMHDGDMRRDTMMAHEDRGRKGRSSSKDREHRSGHDGRDSRNKIRRTFSPNRFRHSKQREEHFTRGIGGEFLPPPQERGKKHHEENWPRNILPPRGVSPTAGQSGRDVWVEQHHLPPPVRSRIDDGPDCRLIINKKRSTTFPEDEHDLRPPSGVGGGGRHGPQTSRNERRSRDRDERRQLSLSPPSRTASDLPPQMAIAHPQRPPSSERERNVGQSMRQHQQQRTTTTDPMKELRRLKNIADKQLSPDSGMDKPRGSLSYRRRGGGGIPSRGGGGPADRIGHRGGSVGRPRSSGSKKPVFDRLDIRRGRSSGHRWPR